VVAISSDVVANGCQECPFGDAEVRIWRADAAIEDQAAAASLMAARNADVTVQADRRYERALEAGSYLLCVQVSCLGVDVTEGATRTVNIKQREGPTSFFVGSSTSAPLGEDFGFDVSE
jgi:hypothetical protein